MPAGVFCLGVALCLLSFALCLLSCLVLSCLVVSCLVLSCLVLSCLVWSGLVLSCLVLSCGVLLHVSCCVFHRSASTVYFSLKCPCVLFAPAVYVCLSVHIPPWLCVFSPVSMYMLIRACHMYVLSIYLSALMRVPLAVRLSLLTL